MTLAIIRISFFILIIYGLSSAQTIDTSFSVQLIEGILPEPGIDNQEYSEIDYLEELKDNPININTADIIALQKIPSLDLNYALIIIQFRNKYGHLFAPNELYSSKDIPKSIVKNILPYITTSDIKKKESSADFTYPSAFKIKYRSRLSYNFHNNEDANYNKYPGSKLKLYNRFFLNYNSVEFGLITEKDPGEKSYFDFWTSHIILKNTGPFENIILGDFRSESGFGLILGGPFGFSKTIDGVYPIKKKERLVHPYYSANENDYYRGVGVSLKYNEFRIAGFYSNKFRDASLDSTSQYIYSFLSSGYHRTSTEIMNKYSVHEIKWGIRSEFAFNTFFSAAVLFYRSYYSKQFISNIPYSPSGNRFTNLSFSYDFYPTSAIYLAGEFAYDLNSVASINSLQIPFNKDFLFFSCVRSYPRNFISLSGHSLAEQNGKVQNETGFYNGFKLVTSFGTINVYYDQFRFPFGGYRFPVSNSGEEFLIGYSNSFADKINFKIIFKYENKDYLISNAEQDFIGRRLRNDVRFTLRWDLSGDINVKTAVEYNSIRIQQDNLKEQGILLSNSISISLINYLKLSSSVSFFITDSFFSSVYEYEEYTSGLVTGRILYGEGLKINLFLKYQMFRNIDLSIQYTETFKPKETLTYPLNSTITNNLILQLDSMF